MGAVLYMYWKYVEQHKRRWGVEAKDSESSHERKKWLERFGAAIAIGNAAMIRRSTRAAAAKHTSHDQRRRL
jgi:hypothetical protein